MSQEKVNSASTYEVKASYYVMDIDEAGMPIETKKENQTIKLWKLQRRNIEHSRLAMNILNGETDNIDLVLQFVKCAVVDENIKKELLGDAFAALGIYASTEVREDLERFFGNWEFLKTLPEISQPSEKE